MRGGVKVGKERKMTGRDYVGTTHTHAFDFLLNNGSIVYIIAS
jgi:hypothetical protein